MALPPRQDLHGSERIRPLATVAILKRFVQLNDEDLVAKIYDYHKRAETPDGKIDAVIAADTIRDSLQAEAITKDVPVNQVFDFSYLPPR